VVRLLLVAAGATAGTRALSFGDSGHLVQPERVEPLTSRVNGWFCGPEPCCRQTARLLGGAPAVLDSEPTVGDSEPTVLDGLGGPDFSRWAGRELTEVGESEPEELNRWLSDPAAAPHGGESLADLVRRVGAVCDTQDWPQGRSVLVVTPLVARAAAVHALGVGPAAIFRLDLAPLGRVGLSGQARSWRLQQLG
jgi:broad specificity phosphatase PhoE